LLCGPAGLVCFRCVTTFSPAQLPKLPSGSWFTWFLVEPAGVELALRTGRGIKFLIAQGP